MEPVEINAGKYYLRQFRSDDRVDDRPAIVTTFTDPLTRRWVNGYHITDLDAAKRYISRRTEEWAVGRRCSWAVADPVSGELLGEVGLKEVNLVERTAEVACWTHPAYRGKGIVVEALGAVLRFAFQGLGLHHVGYRHADGNDASRRVAQKSGFTLDGRLRQATMVEERPRDLLVWSRLSSDAG